MEKSIVEETQFAELDEENMVLILTCHACKTVLTTGLAKVAVFESVKCRECGKINSFQRSHVEKAKEIVTG